MGKAADHPHAGPLLLERERELETLGDAVSAAIAGSARLVLVEGPAGIGKSRLIAAARRQAESRGMLVLSARGSELERDFPFGIVRQLFEARLTDSAARTGLLAGAAAPATTVFGPPDDRIEGEPGEGTFATLHGLYWLVVNLCADAPVLLTVDDLHWCDRGSLRFLAYLAHRLEDLPLLLVGSLRPSEPGADQALLAELTSEPLARLLVPQPLSAAAAADVVRERLGDDVEPAFAEACHASTRGNPLLLDELLKALVAERVRPDAGHVNIVAELGPRAASRAVLLRLARLSGAAAQVARAVAVLGDGADLTAAAVLAGVDRQELGRATRELVQAEILRSELPVGFVHPLVRAAVYHDLAPGEREAYHERAAGVLSELGAPTENVAAHVLAMPARGQSWVVEVLRAAAHIALARGAPDAAISSLRRALEEPPDPGLRPELLLELGGAEVLTSLPASVESLRQAHESTDDPLLRARAADGLARALVFIDAPDEAAEIAGRAAREVSPELRDLAGRLEAMELITVFFGAAEDGTRLERLRALRSIDPSRDVGAKMLAAVAAWEWTESAGPADEAVALAQAALRGGDLLAADSGLMPVLATLPLVLADRDEAIESWDAMQAAAHRDGSIFSISGVQLWGGYTQFLRGELIEAESQLRASLETLSLWGIPTQSQWTTAFLTELLIERGALHEARTLLDAATDPLPRSDQALLLDRAGVRMLLAEGRFGEALERSELLAQRAGWRCHPRYAPWRSLKAQALDRLGRREEAVELATSDLGVARGWGSPGTVGRSLRVLGVIERDEGLEHLEEACMVLEGAPARLEHAKALAALGGALRRARRPSEAREPLRRALELAEICGATPLAAAARGELHATGARPRTTALSGLGSLTASERRVVDLAAAGQSNRDIAQSLYVTPKTVEVHLSNAYRKLGVAGRRDLPRALAADGGTATSQAGGAGRR